MRRLKAMFLTVVTFMFATTFVNAASRCDATEAANLNREVVNIKASYEEAEGVLDPDEYLRPPAIEGEEYDYTYNYFKITIMNITENFYIEVTNDQNNQKLRFDYSDSEDGVVTFDWEGLSEVTNFTIKVYASNNTKCSGETYRTVYLTTPRYNSYYNYAICNEASDYYMCQKYVSFKDVDYYTFMESVNKYIEKKEQEDSEKEAEKNDNFLKKAGNFIAEHKTAFIVSGVVVVVVAGVAVTVIIRKRRSSEI